MKKNTALIITTSILSVVLIATAILAGVFFAGNAETMKSVFSNSGQSFVLSSVAEAEKADAVASAVTETVNVANANTAEAVNEAYRRAEEEKKSALNAAEKEKSQIIEDNNKALADAQIEKEQAVSDAYTSGYNAKLPNVFEIEDVNDLPGLSITNANQWRQTFDAPEYEPIEVGEYVEYVALKYSDNVLISQAGLFQENGFLKQSSDEDLEVKDEALISLVNTLIDDGKYVTFSPIKESEFHSDCKFVPLIANIELEDIVITTLDAYLYTAGENSSNAKQLGVFVSNSKKMYTYGFNIGNFDTAFTCLGCWKFEDTVKYIANTIDVGKFISKTFYTDCYPVYSDSVAYKGYLATLSLPINDDFKMYPSSLVWNYDFTFKINGNYYNNFAQCFDDKTITYDELYGGYTGRYPRINLWTAYLIEGMATDSYYQSKCPSYYNYYINGEYTRNNGMVFLIPNRTIFDYNSGESLAGGCTMLVFFPEEIESFEIVSIQKF